MFSHVEHTLLLRRLGRGVSKGVTGVELVVAGWFHPWAGRHGLLLFALLFGVFTIYELGRYGDVVFETGPVSKTAWRRAWIAVMAVIFLGMLALGRAHSVQMRLALLGFALSLAVLRELDFRLNRETLRREAKGSNPARERMSLFKQLGQPLTGTSLVLSFAYAPMLVRPDGLSEPVLPMGLLGVSIPAFLISLWIWWRRSVGRDRWSTPVGTITGYGLLSGSVAVVAVCLVMALRESF